MKFLENLDFNKDDIAEFNENTPDKLKDLIRSQKRLVSENITYLKELGIPNYKDIFITYYDMFLMDHSNFVDIFSKYDIQDLGEKLTMNPNIVEYL